MRRVLVVVATFVALNTGGFLTYRALQPESAAASAPAADDETFSRPAAVIQPNPTTAAPEAPPEPEESHSTRSTVSPPTTPPEADDERDRDHEKHVKRAPSRRVHRATTPAQQKTKPTESLPAEQPKSGIQNSVLEMDDNPYKRGE